MKKLLAILMLGLSPLLLASDFGQHLLIENNFVIHPITEYEKTHTNDVYHFYIRNDIKQVGPKQFLVHTMVEYILEDGIKYAELGYSVKRIYNYGMIVILRKDGSEKTRFDPKTKKIVKGSK